MRVPALRPYCSYFSTTDAGLTVAPSGILAELLAGPGIKLIYQPDDTNGLVCCSSPSEMDGMASV